MTFDQRAILACPSVMLLPDHELETCAALAGAAITHEKRWLAALDAEKRRRGWAADATPNHPGNEVTT